MSNEMIWRARFKRSGSPAWEYISLGLELLELEDASYCRHVALRDLIRRGVSGEEIEEYELAYTVTSHDDCDFQRWALFYEKIHETMCLILKVRN